jgi:uroporphyrinogen-III synthase
MQFIVTRPDSDAADLARDIAALGQRPILAPLLDVRPTGAPLDFAGVQAIIATSRNALRVLADGPFLDEAVLLPVFVVGAASSALARRLGFRDVVAGDAGARDLPPLIDAMCRPDAGALLYLSGDIVAYDLEPVLAGRGYAVRRKVVYEAAAATTLPDAATAAIREDSRNTGVLLMSRRSAQVFIQLCAGLGLAAAARDLTYICMSDAVSNGLGEPAPARLQVAAKPTSEEMLALVKELASNQP